MKAARSVNIALVVAYAVLWAGGVASYVVLGAPPAGSGWTAPAFLFLAAALAIRFSDPRHRLALVVAGIVGLLAEVIGLKSGFPFGHYTYTAVLRPTVLGVPLAIGCAWLVLFAYVQQMLWRMRFGRRWRAVAGAAWMVAIDLLIDPLAAGPLGFWTWSAGGWYYGIPATNFAGWFAVSLVLMLALSVRPMPTAGPAGVGLSIIAFFTAIALGVGVWGAALVGVLLCLLHLAVLLRYAPRM